MVEQLTVNQLVLGSIPRVGAKLFTNMKCSNCKFLEIIPLYHVFGKIANCSHPDSKLDPETSKEEDLNNCTNYKTN